MKTYYRHGDTYFELDHENKVVANITVNDYNKCMVVSSGLNGPFSSTYEAFEANLTRNQLQGPQFVSSSFEEYSEKKGIVVQYLLSQSLGL
jgi:hypothetical protein